MKRSGKMKKITGILTAVIALAMLLTACGSDSEMYTDEVKNGYLGGYLDVTVGEVLEQSIPGGSWDSGETDSGKIIVEYSANIEDVEFAIQFTVTDSDHFHLSAMVIDGMSPESTDEAGTLLESRYASYYGIKYPDRPSSDFVPNEPAANVTEGISAALAEKAKAPVDISEYFAGSSDKLKTSLGLTDEDGLLTNPDMYLMYDEDLGAVDTASVSGRGYSLFGAAPYMTIETALEKVADKFTVVSDKDNYDGTYSVMLIKNDSEDSLIINYDLDWRLTGEISYMKDGLMGYREEAAQAEAAETGASWEDIAGCSFVCPDSGADVFIGMMTDYMQPYIEGIAGDGYTEVYGTLTENSKSKLHYSADNGDFDIIVYNDSIVISNATGSLTVFEGSYEIYSSVKAG